MAHKVDYMLVDEQTSPEKLTSEPIKDPYSTDDERNPGTKTSSKSKSTTRKREEKPVLLKHTNACDMSAAEVLFFFDLDYMKQPSHPKNFTSFTVEKMLESLLRFAFDDDDDDDVIDDDVIENDVIDDVIDDVDYGIYTINGQTVPQMYQELLKKSSVLKMMVEVDDLNLKSCTPEDYVKKMEELERIQSEFEDKEEIPSHRRTVLELIDTIMIQYPYNGLGDHNRARTVSQFLGQLLPWRCSAQCNGMASYLLKYMVSNEIVSEKSPSASSKVYPDRDRLCFIGVQPDTVYSVYGVEKIAVQVFAPDKSSSSTTSSEDDEVILPENSSDGIEFQKPVREKDGILKQDYRTAANKFLQQFLSEDCKDEATLNKLFGQHVLELICIAGNALPKLNNKPNTEVLGMFMKNEYIFFSKLAVNYTKLQSYDPFVIDSNRREVNYSRSGVWNKGVGRLSMANWRLDLTQANHRIATVAFLTLFCKICKDQLRTSVT